MNRDNNQGASAPTSQTRRNIMRKEFVQVNTRKQAQNECPWAAKIVKVVGGYMCFESHTDYEIWRNQK